MWETWRLILPKRTLASPNRVRTARRCALAALKRVLVNPTCGPTSPTCVLATPRDVLTTRRRVLTTRKRVLTTRKRVLTTRKRVLTTPRRALTTRKCLLATPAYALTTPRHALTTRKCLLLTPTDAPTTPRYALSTRKHALTTPNNALTTPKSLFIPPPFARWSCTPARSPPTRTVKTFVHLLQSAITSPGSNRHASAKPSLTAALARLMPRRSPACKQSSRPTRVNGHPCGSGRDFFMSTTRNVTVKGVELNLDMLLNGLASLFTTTNTIVVGGVAYTQKDFVKKVTDVVTPYKTRRDARTAFAQAQLSIAADEVATQKFVRAAKLAAVAVLGEDNPELAKLGFAPRRKATPQTSADKALKAERGRQTRQDRDTMGSRQKESVRAPELDQLTIGRSVATPASSPADPTKKAV